MRNLLSIPAQCLWSNDETSKHNLNSLSLLQSEKKNIQEVNGLKPFLFSCSLVINITKYLCSVSYGIGGNTEFNYCTCPSPCFTQLKAFPFSPPVTFKAKTHTHTLKQSLRDLHFIIACISCTGVRVSSPL